MEAIEDKERNGKSRRELPWTYSSEGFGYRHTPQWGLRVKNKKDALKSL
jgi:hypothetical protein